MNCMVTGLAKTGTTILFASIRDGFPRDRECFFEPRTAAEFEHIVSRGGHTNTLTKALLPSLLKHSHVIARFDPIVLIVRDPRDQFISQMLYTFYDFNIRGDRAGYERARELLRRKIESPSTVSTIQLYDSIASLAGRPGPDVREPRGWRGNTRGWCAFSTSIGRTRSGTRISWMAGRGPRARTGHACLHRLPGRRRASTRRPDENVTASGGRGSPPRTSSSSIAASPSRCGAGLSRGLVDRKPAADSRRDDPGICRAVSPRGCLRAVSDRAGRVGLNFCCPPHTPCMFHLAFPSVSEAGLCKPFRAYEDRRRGCP